MVNLDFKMVQTLNYSPMIKTAVVINSKRGDHYGKT